MTHSIFYGIRLKLNSERKLCKYTKKATEYWESTIKERRKRHKQLSYEKPLNCEGAEDISVTMKPAHNVAQTTGKRKKSTSKSK